MFDWFSKLLRLPRSRGFGVQSPTDYHFLRHVIRQKMAYYAYTDLEKNTLLLSKREKEILRYYFRLANYIQDGKPLFIVGKENFGNITPQLRKLFLMAGSRKVRAVHIGRISNEVVNGESCTIVVENLQNCRDILKELRGNKTVFDMQDIATIFCNDKNHDSTYRVNL